VSQVPLFLFSFEGYCFNEPIVNPLTRFFCTINIKMNAGIMAPTPNAAMLPQAVPVDVTNVDETTGTVLILVCVSVSTNRNSVQLKIKHSTAVDDAGIGVKQPKLLVDKEHGDSHSYRRHHAGGQYPEHEVMLTSKAHPG